MPEIRKIASRVRPHMVLADELAYANAPGAKNPRQYQDAERLLEAGIHVISTLAIRPKSTVNRLFSRSNKKV